MMEGENSDEIFQCNKNSSVWYIFVTVIKIYHYDKNGSISFVMKAI